jgi:hypothetical protein
MRSRMATAIIAVLVFAALAGANDQLIATLKTLGKAVDEMSANISKAASDADAELLANATRQALDNGIAHDRPKIEVNARAGYCRITMETPAWRLWSEAKAGKITSHGAMVH